MLNLAAFIVAIGILVFVHELGHFLVARLCGVKVLCFSVGFGPRLWRFISKRSGTEFVVGMLPLGGYVKMLDDRDGIVPPGDMTKAFNAQSVHCRVAIVLAGPTANLLLAVALYSCVNWTNVEMAQAIVAKPPDVSLLASAGFVGGEQVLRAGFEDDVVEKVVSFDEFRWLLLRGAIEQRNVQVEFKRPQNENSQVALVKLHGLDARSVDAKLLAKIGATLPFMRARIGYLEPGEPAELAHLLKGDVVVSVDDTAIVDGAQLYELIRSSGRSGEPASQTWIVERQGVLHSLQVRPKSVRVEVHFLKRIGAVISTTFGNKGEVKDLAPLVGRIGAEIAAPPATVTIRYEFLEGLDKAVLRSWDNSVVTVRVLWQMVSSLASLDNLSGPISIAGYAGKSAAMGLTPFLNFLAVMSVSLGVLNMLPVPVLDGGHLMYYLWEALSGKPVSQLWTERLQKLGLVALLMVMSLAMVNDVTRLLR